MSLYSSTKYERRNASELKDNVEAVAEIKKHSYVYRHIVPRIFKESNASEFKR